MSEISEAEFYAVWGVRPAESGDLLCFDDIRSCPDNVVWTVVESGEEGDGNWYAMPGVHLVNALGYVTTRRQWDDLTPQATYFLDDLK